MKKILAIILFPFAWLLNFFQKHFNEIRKNSFNRLFLVIFPNFIFSILGLSLILYNFKSFNKDTTDLTNYGFAILIGLSSVCFAWARSFKDSEDIESLKIRCYAENFLHCSVIFLITSGIKYAYLHIDELISKDWIVTYYCVTMIIGSVHSICFTLAFLKIDQTIRGVNAMLYDRIK